MGKGREGETLRRCHVETGKTGCAMCFLATSKFLQRQKQKSFHHIDHSEGAELDISNMEIHKAASSTLFPLLSPKTNDLYKNMSPKPRLEKHSRRKESIILAQAEC